ncbi:alpha/beta fold hydrolase [Bacillus cytotoxicus]|uniref:Alpha/beta hydrolase fold n=1 Tax=Bacillus cytotoxicus TaxID=580165 RepID=A0AAX2CGI8_9BACI|nr:MULTISPECIES: alpha/beta hydrolase [Bacillus cereus group]QTR72778.1 alpha/beta hydrolase [Bacillus cytotoxicus]QTR77944.1 alpha/beta hydrolase [Bacillus cytotoxicus]QTR82237.1 alpha/beta hydrolase [Bacillus cytotoxicus]QTR85975.1 alpha/beta hydrolase [Bacillus cytotoxicus]SCL92189.1 Alpha/beta hydrolase fold [Bacillus cytotoxicus]
MILHANISGAGEPIVFLHSGGMTGLTEFEEQTEFFKKESYKIIRPDLRGHGKTGGSIKNYFSQCPDDIRDTLEFLQVNRCHIAGVSIDGLVALLFAKKYPEKVKSLTFSGIFPMKTENWDEDQKEEAIRHKMLFENEEIVNYMNQIHVNSDWKALIESWNEEDWYPFSETREVSSLQVPSLCIVGGESKAEVTAAMIFKELNPAIHIAVIPFASHLVHRDQPDVYSNILSKFLQSVKAASREN